MKAMSLALFIFLVAGQAVAKEDKKLNQPVISPIPGCTCAGLNRNTGKAWTNDECKLACESKRALQQAMGNEGSVFNSLNSLANAAPKTEDQPQAKIGEAGAGKDRLQSRIIFGTILGGLGFVSLIGFVAWKSDLLQTIRRKKKKRYRTDQEKAVLAKTPLPAAPMTESRPPAAAQLSVVQANQPEPQTSLTFEDDVIDVSRDRDQMGSIIFWLEKAVNPEIYPWAKWGSKLSAFTMGWRGFQPEMEVFAGGIEISIQEENRELWLKVITYAIQEVFPVSLKLVVIESRKDDTTVFVLMPEESVQYALTGDSSVLTLTEGLRQHLLNPGHEQRRAANQ